MSVTVTLAYRLNDVDDRLAETGPSYEHARDAARSQLPEGALALSYRVASDES